MGGLIGTQKKKKIKKENDFDIYLSNKRNKIELYLDFSTSCTGYAISHHGHIVKHGSIERDEKKENKYQYTQRLADHLISEMLTLPTKDFTCDVVIEANYVGANPSVGLLLSFHRGQLIALLKPERYVQVLPSQWRKKVGIKGNASTAVSKESAINRCRPAGIIQNDEAEATCIGFACGADLTLEDGSSYRPYLMGDDLPI